MAGLGQLFALVLCIFGIVSHNFPVGAEPYSDFERKFTRKLSPIIVNPGCNLDWCRNTTLTGGALAHTVSAGADDELHYLFCTIGAPSVMISRTSIGSKLEVDYETLITPDGNEAINFTKAPHHSFGMIFSTLYEYDDFNDTANMTDYRHNKTAMKQHHLTDLNWVIVSHTGDHVKQTLVVNATRPQSQSNQSHELFKENGYLSFRIRYDSEIGRLTTRPHMQYTANSTMVTVVMANLTSQFPSSRFAVEMVMFSTENHTKDPAQEHNSTQVFLTNSLDDEYSPGVFQMRNWMANEDKPRSKAWGYAQWKPVVYTKTERLNADLSHATSYPNINRGKQYILNNTLPYRSLFSFYFRKDDWQDISVNATNVSYGLTNDKFFANTEYLVWTMSMGLGPAPEDDVSTLVILVIAIGLGIPLILMIMSTVYVCVRNLRKRSRQTYTAIDD